MDRVYDLTEKKNTKNLKEIWKSSPERSIFIKEKKTN